MKKTICRILTGGLLLVWMILIFCFSAQPAKESGEVSGTLAYRMITIADEITGNRLSGHQKEMYADLLNPPLRKAAHMTEYAVLAALLFLFLACMDVTKQRCCLFCILLSFLYAASDELHQLFVPGRSGSVKDVLIDGTGAVIAAALIFGVSEIGRRRRQSGKQ